MRGFSRLGKVLWKIRMTGVMNYEYVVSWVMLLEVAGGLREGERGTFWNLGIWKREERVFRLGRVAVRRFDAPL